MTPNEKLLATAVILVLGVGGSYLLYKNGYKWGSGWIAAGVPTALYTLAATPTRAQSLPVLAPLPIPSGQTVSDSLAVIVGGGGAV